MALAPFKLGLEGQDGRRRERGWGRGGRGRAGPRTLLGSAGAVAVRLGGLRASTCSAIYGTGESAVRKNTGRRLGTFGPERGVSPHAKVASLTVPAREGASCDGGKAPSRGFSVCRGPAAVVRAKGVASGAAAASRLKRSCDDVVGSVEGAPARPLGSPSVFSTAGRVSTAVRGAEAICITFSSRREGSYLGATALAP